MTVTSLPLHISRVFTSWQYAVPGKRDLRLDLLRGFCLMVMLIDHLGGNSWMYAITGGGEFYISAAEGFIFISGLVLGLISARQTLAATIQRILKRTWILYLVTISITIGFAAAGFLTNLNIWYDVDPKWGENPLAFLASALTLHTAFHGSDILVLYVLLMLISPLAFYAFHQGKGWLVLLISWLVWLGNLFYPQAFTTPFHTVFPFAAWQPIFFTGLVIGYYRSWLARHFPARKLYYAFVLLLAALLLANYHLNFLPDLQQPLSNKAALPLPRMVAIAVFLQTFMLLATWFWGIINARLGWLLLPLGKAGLWVFSMHLVVMVLFRSIPGYFDMGIAGGTIGHMLAILALWGTAIARNYVTSVRWRDLVPQPINIRTRS